MLYQSILVNRALIDLPDDPHPYPHLWTGAWVATKRTRSQMQVAETSFLQRVTSLSLRVEPLLLHIERSLMRFFGNLTRKLLGVSWVRCSRYVTAGGFLLDGWTGCITTFTPTKTPYKTNFCPITDTVVLLCWWQTYRIPGCAICDTLINPHTHMLGFSTKRHTCRHIQGCKMQWHRCFVWCALYTTKYTQIHIQDRNQYLEGRVKSDSARGCQRLGSQ